MTHLHCSKCPKQVHVILEDGTYLCAEHWKRYGHPAEIACRLNLKGEKTEELTPQTAKKQEEEEGEV